MSTGIDAVVFRSLCAPAGSAAALLDLIAAGTETAQRALPMGWRRTPEQVADVLLERRLWLAQFAVVGARVVGFKLGYGRRPERFYSWLGGVHPDFRRRGIARRFMVEQHDWCAARGVEVIETATTNGFRGMLLLNLHSGFDVVGTRTTDGQLSILMSKRLAPPS